PSSSPPFPYTTLFRSCSHRGVINTVQQAIKASGVDKVHAVLGGFHIVPPLGDDYIRDTVAEFRKIDPDYLIVGHCTGDRFYDLRSEEHTSELQSRENL